MLEFLREHAVIICYVVIVSIIAVIVTAKDKIRAIISNVSKLGYPVKFKDSKTVFDDSKIEAHSALTPTYKIPDKDKLSPDEAKVYSTVFRRFVAVFCSEPCVAEKSEIKFLSVSIFSSRWAESSIYLPFSRPRR